MSVSANFESQLQLAVQNTLKAAFVGPFASVKVQTPGVPYAAIETDPEWVTYSPLAVSRDSARAGDVTGSFLFQVTCFSRTVANRIDGDAFRASRLAGVVRGALEDKGLTVLNWGDVTLGSESTVCFLRLGKARARFVGEPDVQVSAGQSPADPAQIQAVVVEFTARFAKV